MSRKTSSKTAKMDGYRDNCRRDNLPAPVSADGQLTGPAVADAVPQLEEDQPRIQTLTQIDGQPDEMRSTNPDHHQSTPRAPRAGCHGKTGGPAKRRQRRQDTSNIFADRARQAPPTDGGSPAPNTSFTESLIVHTGAIILENPFVRSPILDGCGGAVEHMQTTDYPAVEDHQQCAFFDDIDLLNRDGRASQWVYDNTNAPWNPLTVNHRGRCDSEDVELGRSPWTLRHTL